MDSIIKNFCWELVSPLTLADRRCYHLLLNAVRAGGPQQHEASLPLTVFKYVYGVAPATPLQIHSSLLKLITSYFSYQTSSNLHGQFCTVFDKLEVTDQQVFISFNPSASKILANPRWDESHILQAHFVYKYSNLLYEMAADYYYRGITEFKIELVDLRTSFNLSAAKLTNFNDLHRFALTPALNEINTHASFRLDFIPVRAGRKVIALNFTALAKAYDYQHNPSELHYSEQCYLELDHNPVWQDCFAFLMQANIEERSRWFKLACQEAASQGSSFKSEDVDSPELWLSHVIKPWLARVQ